jgi:signal transduction histidine kinase/ActR/RegA family two-component response regulator
VALAGGAVLLLVVVILQQSAAVRGMERQWSVAAHVQRDLIGTGLGILVRVNGADLAARTYLLQPDATHQRRLQLAMKQVGSSLQAFEAAANGEPWARRHIPALEALVARRLAVMRQTAALTGQGQRDQALQLIQSGDLVSAQIARELGAVAIQARDREASVRQERVKLMRRAHRLESGLAVLTAIALLLALGSLLMERLAARRAAQTRARMDAAVEQARLAAEEANAAKSRFLAAASHDMRQPLHALTLYIGALERRVAGDEGREILANMDSAVQAMTRMFSALLDLARLEAGVLTPELAVFPLGELLDDVARQAADPAARGPKVRVVPTDVQVRSDPDLLEVILRNLAANAVKHSRGGKVLLGCRRVGDAVRIEVHDDGEGIAPALLTRLFGEFVRGEAASSTEGVGLGLAIVERMALLLSHPLDVESEPGHGSVFSITVPRAQTPASSVASASPVRPSLAGVRILVADDEALALDAMARALTDLGAEVARAASAEQVRARAGERFDAYVFDLNLGRDSGMALLDELDRRAGRTVRGLLVTGATTPEVLAELRARDRMWLTKPISAEALAAQVKTLLAAPQDIRREMASARVRTPSAR